MAPSDKPVGRIAGRQLMENCAPRLPSVDTVSDLTWKQFRDYGHKHRLFPTVAGTPTTLRGEPCDANPEWRPEGADRARGLAEDHPRERLRHRRVREVGDTLRPP